MARQQHLTTHQGDDYICVYREGQTTEDAIVTIKYPSKADVELAHQFAAAPNLLAALKAVVPAGWLDNDTMEHMPGIKLARAAIAKARGQ